MRLHLAVHGLEQPGQRGQIVTMEPVLPDLGVIAFDVLIAADESTVLDLHSAVHDSAAAGVDTVALAGAAARTIIEA